MVEYGNGWGTVPILSDVVHRGLAPGCDESFTTKYRYGYRSQIA